ncbi:MAG: signal peptidase I [Actinomycetaceae bacterium]|nr:signal peptidase I [Arcanobacterium sp.]MDD7504490.1 signal peptidase I [Actinomycetaceae bacterium]
MAEPGSDDARYAQAPAEMPPSFPPEGNQHGISSANTGATSPEASDKSLMWRVAGAIGEFIVIIAIGLLSAVVVKTFFLQAFTIPSASMQDSLIPGDEIMVNKLADTTDELERGDVVVFEDPGQWLAGVQEPQVSPVREHLNAVGRAVGLLPRTDAGFLVKRMIGKSGDHVVCCDPDGKITINGEPITETYLGEGIEPSREAFDVTVPDGYMWVMGDNRSNSKDSRFHQQATGFGFVPEDLIQGRAWLLMYPLNRFGTLRDYSDVFAHVPAPQPQAQGASAAGASGADVSAPHAVAGAAPSTAELRVMMR